MKIRIVSQAVVHTFNPSTWDAGAGESLEAREFQDCQGYKEKPCLEKFNALILMISKPCPSIISKPCPSYLLRNLGNDEDVGEVVTYHVDEATVVCYPAAGLHFP